MKDALFDLLSTACYDGLMTGARRMTIRDVAAAAGVSLTTVSDALSGKGRLPEATRKKVREVAAQLDYRPDAVARGLRGQGLGLIGVLITPAKSASLSNVWYWATIAAHAGDAILSQGFAPVLLPHNIASLKKLRVPIDGAIVVDPFEGDDVLAHLQQRKIEFVTIGYDTANRSVPWLDDDNEEGMKDLLRQTAVPGERITAVTYGPRKSYVADALRGLHTQAKAASLVVEEVHCAELDDPHVDATLEAVRASGSTVIVAQHDRLAVRILTRLKAAGLRVPSEIRLLSATDAPELQNTEPSLTALRQHPDALGRLAAKALFDRLRGEVVASSQLLTMEVIIRGSAPALEAVDEVLKQGAGRRPTVLAIGQDPRSGDALGNRPLSGLT
jgi:DNA-binding LacI/PurR family transcriptional regulator